MRGATDPICTQTGIATPARGDEPDEPEPASNAHRAMAPMISPFFDNGVATSKVPSLNLF